MVGQFGARSDQAHVAFQHIPELRKLLKFIAAQKYANRSNAGIAAHCNRWSRRILHSHRAEFIERTVFPVAARTALPEKGGPGSSHEQEA